jgi:S1-C subfamily serine protease
MRSYLPYLGIVAAIGVAALVVVNVPVVSHVQSPNPLVPLATATTTVQAPAGPAEAASRRVLEAEPKPVDVHALKAELTQAGFRLRAALVNIWCVARADSGIPSISASGVVVGSRGYILTNAHVGQYFLLADRGVTCTVRTGSPARDAYHASLAYISPAWVRANAALITQASPVGTGEHDIAVLAITGAIAPHTMPQTFAYTPLSAARPYVSQPVAVAAYAGQSLVASDLEKALSPTGVISLVQEVLTFASDTPDVVAISGSIAAQEGASGGGVVNAEGELIGLVTTSKTTGPLEGRRIGAITASYLRSEYLSQVGTTLDVLLAAAPASAVSAFAAQAAQLAAILEQALDQK